MDRKRDGSTEGIRKLSEAVSATLRDEVVNWVGSFQTVPARFGQYISTRKQDSEHYQVHTRLIKTKVKFFVLFTYNFTPENTGPYVRECFVLDFLRGSCFLTEALDIIRCYVG